LHPAPHRATADLAPSRRESGSLFRRAQQKEERQEMYRKAAPVIEVGAKLLVRMLTKK
jgi:hypothetical protein